ncbi:MAG: TatD family hydrolase [Syntrophobacteraceae bacterium]
MLIDTHAHLDMPELGGDLDGVLTRAAAAGVGEIITIGVDLPSSCKALELARNCRRIYATVGVHPHDSFPLDEEAVGELIRLAGQERVVAIGEIGLDYYWDHQPRAVQQECLRRQLELAAEVALPVVFHIRNAYEDFMDIIRDYAGDLAGGVMHCFSGDWGVAEFCLDLGFYLSIPGTVTFPKSGVQQDVVRRAPADRLLVETDSPYLAPVPWRGKVNEPAFVACTARKVAELRDCTFEEIAGQTTGNARRAFGLPSADAGEEVA